MIISLCTECAPTVESPDNPRLLRDKDPVTGVFGKYKLTLPSINVLRFWAFQARKRLAARKQEASDDDAADDVPVAGLVPVHENPLLMATAKPVGLTKGPDTLAATKTAASVVNSMKADIVEYEEKYGREEELPASDSEPEPVDGDGDGDGDGNEDGGDSAGENGENGDAAAATAAAKPPQGLVRAKAKRRRGEIAFFVPDSIRRLLKRWLEEGRKAEKDFLEGIEKKKRDIQRLRQERRDRGDDSSDSDDEKLGQPVGVDLSMLSR